MVHLEKALYTDNDWWKYIVVFLVAMIGAQLIGAIPLIAVLGYKVTQNPDLMSSMNPENPLDFTVWGVDPVLGLALLIIPFLVGLVVMIWIIKRLHKRSLNDTINGREGIRWGRFFYSALIWALIMGAFVLVGYYMEPENYEVRFDLASLIPLILVSLILIPFQTTFEEVLFRGYLAQGFGAWTRNRWIALIIPSVIFGLIHMANPEVSEYGFWLTMPQYIAFGLVFGLVAILDDGIECAMGAHAANNTFLSIFVTSKASALQTPAILNQLEVDPSGELWGMLIMCGIFVAVLAVKYQWNFGVMNEPIAIDDIADISNDSTYDSFIDKME